jgi:hypothetical protein
VIYQSNKQTAETTTTVEYEVTQVFSEHKAARKAGAEQQHHQ